MRILVTAVPDSLGRIFANACWRKITRLYVSIIFSPAERRIFFILDNKSFEYNRHDVTEPILLEVDRYIQPRLSGVAGSLPIQSVKTVKTSVMGMINMLDWRNA